MHLSSAEYSNVCTPIEFDVSAGRLANKTLDIGNNGTALSTNIFGSVSSHIIYVIHLNKTTNSFFIDSTNQHVPP